MSGAVFRAKELHFQYPGAPEPAIRDANFGIGEGTITGIIGPNGSGKSTLLRLLLGTLEPIEGEVYYEGRPVRGWARRELARAIGVVPQSEEVAFPLSVRELVAMGRYPHLGAWRREGTRDRVAIEGAMARCTVEHLADRPLDTLSGGELQRARIARALAQEPRTLVLDEPTAALDIRHEMAIFELLRDLAEEGDVTILTVTHNLNLAARYTDRLLLLDQGRITADGCPEDVLKAEVIEEIYRWPITLSRHPGPGPDSGTPQVIPLARLRAEGDDPERST